MLTLFKTSGQELIDALKPAFVRAIKEFYKANHARPEKILVFRDGVGDSQLSMVARSASILISYLRLLLRILQVRGRANPWHLQTHLYRLHSQLRLYRGAEEDQYEDLRLGRQEPRQPRPRDSARPHRHQEGLVWLLLGLSTCWTGQKRKHSANSRFIESRWQLISTNAQGTVSPTHYIVVHDNTGLKPDILQKISYKLTHMYYNWPGTVRVPAPCQYAHKLAYQVVITYNLWMGESPVLFPGWWTHPEGAKWSVEWPPLLFVKSLVALALPYLLIDVDKYRSKGLYAMSQLSI